MGAEEHWWRLCISHIKVSILLWAYQSVISPHIVPIIKEELEHLRTIKATTILLLPFFPLLLSSGSVYILFP